MACFEPGKPEQTSLTQSYGGLGTAQKYLLESDKAFSPLFTQQSMSNLDTLLSGSAGGPTTVNYLQRLRGGKVSPRSYTTTMAPSRGLLDIYERDLAPMMSRTGTAAASAQRAGDVADFANLGGSARSAIQQTNPGGARLLDELTGQASSDLALGASLNPSELRNIQQATRAGQAARGMSMGPRETFDEALNSLNYGRGLQNERRGFASSLVGQNQAMYQEPIMAILGRPSGAGAQAQGFLGQAGGWNTQSSMMPQAALGQDVAMSNFNANAAAGLAGANNKAGFYSGLASY